MKKAGAALVKTITSFKVPRYLQTNTTDETKL